MSAITHQLPEEEQPQSLPPDTAARNSILREAFRTSLANLITPRKGTALSYLAGDSIITYVGHAQDSDALVVGGLLSAAGNTVNIMMVGGKVPHLIAALAILKWREKQAADQQGQPPETIRYSAALSEERFRRLLAEAAPNADDDKQITLYKAAAEVCYVGAGLAFVYGGLNGINLDALTALVNGDGAFANTERTIAAVINSSMVGYGTLFATGATIMVFGNDQSRHHPRKTDVISAWRIARQQKSWGERLRDFRYHTDLNHSGSMFMILGSSCLLIGAAALLAGGAAAASAPLAGAGMLLAAASMLYMVGDYCMRLDESSSMRLQINPRKKKIYRLRMRALLSPRTRRAIRVSRATMKAHRARKAAAEKNPQP